MKMRVRLGERIDGKPCGHLCHPIGDSQESEIGIESTLDGVTVYNTRNLSWFVDGPTVISHVMVDLPAGVLGKPQSIVSPLGMELFADQHTTVNLLDGSVKIAVIK